MLGSTYAGVNRTGLPPPDKGTRLAHQYGQGIFRSEQELASEADEADRGPQTPEIDVRLPRKVGSRKNLPLASVSRVGKV